MGTGGRLGVIALAIVVIAATGCSSGEPGGEAATADTTPAVYPPPVARSGEGEADTLLDWVDLANGVIRRESLAPPVATRYLGYLGLAVGEAVTADAEGRGLGVDGLELPAPPADALDRSLAASAAAATVTTAFIPGTETSRAVESLVAQHVTAAAGRSSSDVAGSETFGRAVGDAVVALASSDGYDGLPQRVPDEDGGPGQWVPTPPGFLYTLEPRWGTLRPIVAGDADCPVPDPVPYDETPGSPFWEQGMAVAEAKATLDDAGRATARYWRDQPGTSYTPAGHWMHIAARAIEADVAAGQLDLDGAARTIAALGVAQSDAFIATWVVKYRTDVLRPITYLRRVMDPSWDSTIITPPFPAYTSGHSTGSAASATVLSALLGDRPFTDTAGEINDYPSRSYPSFAAAADESSLSRLLGGIHFPMDLDAGKVQGRCIASVVLERLGD